MATGRLTGSQNITSLPKSLVNMVLDQESNQRFLGEKRVKHVRKQPSTKIKNHGKKH
jgi:hypothetical protein